MGIQGLGFSYPKRGGGVIVFGSLYRKGLSKPGGGGVNDDSWEFI